MNSRKPARTPASRGKKSRGSPTRIQVRLKQAQHKALLAACGKHDTDASNLIRNWVAALLQKHRAGRKITGMTAPEAFKDDPRELVLDARLHVTVEASTLKRFRNACHSQGVAHSRVVRGLVDKIVEMHREGCRKITPPPTRKR